MCVRDFSIASIHCIRFSSSLFACLFFFPLLSRPMNCSIFFLYAWGSLYCHFVQCVCTALTWFSSTFLLGCFYCLARGFFFQLKMDPDMSESFFVFVHHEQFAKWNFIFLVNLNSKFDQVPIHVYFFLSLSYKRSGWHFIFSDFFFPIQTYKNLYISRGLVFHHYSIQHISHFK